MNRNIKKAVLFFLLLNIIGMLSLLILPSEYLVLVVEVMQKVGFILMLLMIVGTILGILDDYNILDIDADLDGLDDYEGLSFAFQLSLRGLVSIIIIYSSIIKGFDYSYMGVVIASVISLLVAIIDTVIWVSMMKLESDGTIEKELLIGSVGEVYVPITRKIGKVTIIAKGRLVQLDSITKGVEKIERGTKVEVVEIEENKLVVKVKCERRKECHQT